MYIVCYVAALHIFFPLHTHTLSPPLTHSASYDPDTLASRLRELAFLNPAAHIHFRVKKDGVVVPPKVPKGVVPDTSNPAGLCDNVLVVCVCVHDVCWWFAVVRGGVGGVWLCGDVCVII